MLRKTPADVCSSSSRVCCCWWCWCCFGVSLGVVVADVFVVDVVVVVAVVVVVVVVVIVVNFGNSEFSKTLGFFPPTSPPAGNH